MKETYYFSHDYNARTDEKIVKLISKEGWQGYGLFWAIVEKLYEADGWIKKDYECLAYDLRTECERIARVVEEYDLFELASEKISSNSVLARLRLRKGKSEQARQSANLRWNKPNKDDANALRTQSEGNAIKERKGKERNTVAKATISIKNEIYSMEELTYEPLEGTTVKKSPLGRKTMVWLAAVYLKAKGIVVVGNYDANKISKGLSKIYQECDKDPFQAKLRIEVAAEYFNSRGLDWTPEAVWRRWEDIAKWLEDGKPSDKQQRENKKKIQSIENNPIYE